MGGWYVGLAIGTLVVLIVVVVVSAILVQASRIVKQATMATEAFDAARVNTLALWDVMKINDSGKAILKACRAARGALGG